MDSKTPVILRLPRWKGSALGFSRAHSYNAVTYITARRAWL